MMLAKRRERNIANDDHVLALGLVELLAQVVLGFVVIAAQDFLGGARDAVGRLNEAGTVGVFAHRDEELTDGAFSTLPIDGHLCPSHSDDSFGTGLNESFIVALS